MSKYGVRFRAVVDRCENVRMPHDYLAVTCHEQDRSRKCSDSLVGLAAENRRVRPFRHHVRKEKIKEALKSGISRL